MILILCLYAYYLLNHRKNASRFLPGESAIIVGKFISEWYNLKVKKLGVVGEVSYGNR